ncbi:hypothetical protein Avbf_13397 [Armadillidium vulgare]|nr:hypothetical protein Avbf_13397 [Armadillidium vulgare]
MIVTRNLIINHLYMIDSKFYLSFKFGYFRVVDIKYVGFIPFTKELIRNKRFIYMDNQRRLSLPTGSALDLTGILHLPFLVDFDELHMTSEDNRFGYFDFGNVTGFFGIPGVNMSAIRPPSLLDPINFPDRLQETLEYALINREKRSTWRAYPGVNYAEYSLIKYTLLNNYNIAFNIT